MLLGLISDTHDQISRTRRAVASLRERGAEALIHCGDLIGPEILAEFVELPTWFVFGNNDADDVPGLKLMAQELGINCLEWCGLVELAGVSLGVCHGHMKYDVQFLLNKKPAYLFSGHTHIPHDMVQFGVRRINPGALHRADQFTVAMLDLSSGQLETIPIER